MPTLIVSDTFESYTAGAAPPAPWTATANTSVQTTQAHAGTKALAVGTGGNASTAVLPLGVTLNSWILDCWLWVNASGATTTQYIGLRVTGTTAGIVLNISQTGAGQVYAPGGTVFFTFTGVTLSTWHHCILTVFQDPTVGTISLTIDGTSMGTFSGNTRDSAGNATVTDVVVQGATIGPSPPAEFYVDDLFAYNNGTIIPTAARLSQALVEAWITRSPPTAAVVSQALVEAWIQRNAPAETFVVSQMVVEVWVRTGAVVLPPHPLFLSSQVP